MWQNLDEVVLFCCMRIRIVFSLLTTVIFFSNPALSQQFFNETPSAIHWRDSVFASLTPEEKIAQLMIVRAHSNLGNDHVEKIEHLIKRYNIGGLCFFQGGPVRQAVLTNRYQSLSRTPLMICIDGEWGLGMRLDSVINLHREMMLGALPNTELVYEYGKLVAQQSKRMGIDVNYAPVVDINNNPQNPVINDRSFGEDKYRVAAYSLAYMKGMQDNGIMATAKHFPGHGDVSVDSHLDLPVINKTRQQLDSLELYPFKTLIEEGVGSVMVAHLYIPYIGKIDSAPNLATSLSPTAITALLKTDMGFKGIVVTDGLEMKGVTKYFPDNEISVQALIAGNDMLCLPPDVEGSIQKVMQAIADGRLSQAQIDASVKKVLLAKYHMNRSKAHTIDTVNLVNDLNEKTAAFKKAVAQQSLTALKANPTLTPLNKKTSIAYININSKQANPTAPELDYFFLELSKYNRNVTNFFVSKSDSLGVDSLLNAINTDYDVVITALHNYSRRPANHFGLPDWYFRLLARLNETNNCLHLVFGNPYAISYADSLPNIVAMYEDDEATQQAVIDYLTGQIEAKGKLPVTVSATLPVGSGAFYNRYFSTAAPEETDVNSTTLNGIDNLINNAIYENAMPGAVVLVAKDGKIIFNRAYGKLSFDADAPPVTTSTVYDIASVTKTTATTVAVMKLYEEGKIDLKSRLADFFPLAVNTNKANITIEEMLAHRGGLTAFLPLHKSTLDASGAPSPLYYRVQPDDLFNIPVAQHLYLRNDFEDSLMVQIFNSRLGEKNKYVYSDVDFILLGKIVEKITNMPLDEYVTNTFFRPLNMSSTRFNAARYFPVNTIAPTEKETNFRLQTLTGYVHDPAAAMFGGVAGHAGVFSNAYDLAQLYQMMLNHGVMNHKRYFKNSTIKKFTAYDNKKISRRGLGFDKPEFDKKKIKQQGEYPAKSASARAYGHLGFTGTCVWVDPEHDLVYVLLSNRVNTSARHINKFGALNIRGQVLDIIYEAIRKGK